jgi:hypothetical protein
MINWTYKDQVVEDITFFSPECFGFVYKIHNTLLDRIYIGKKYLFHTTKTKIGITEKEANKKLNIWKEFKYVKKESDWKKYWGSNKQLVIDYKAQNGEQFTREIIHLCYNKRELTYWEVSYQFKYDVLFNNSYNDNILGKFYTKDFKLE